jgi:hypothetical protein
MTVANNRTAGAKTHNNDEEPIAGLVNMGPEIADASPTARLPGCGWEHTPLVRIGTGRRTLDTWLKQRGRH